MMVALLLLVPCLGTVAPVAPEDFYSGPNCGLYCAYACLRQHGRHVLFDDLLQPEYRSSPRGSSAADLLRLFADQGQPAVARANVNAAYLALIGQPFLLHARYAGRQSSYEHWMLCVGREGDQFLLLDPPKSELFRVHAGELLALTDGVALIVPGGAGWEWSAGMATGAGLLAIALAAAGLLLLIQRLLPRLGLLARTAMGLAVASVLGLGYHALAPHGFFRDRPAVGLVRDQHFHLEAPTISGQELNALQQPQLINACPAWLFQRGHIPASINLPVDSNYFERRQLLAALPRTRTLVVYCQNENCPWSHTIASYLLWHGFDDVRIYRGGYGEWLKQARQSGTNSGAGP